MWGTRRSNDKTSSPATPTAGSMLQTTHLNLLFEIVPSIHDESIRMLHTFFYQIFKIYIKKKKSPTRSYSLQRVTNSLQRMCQNTKNPEDTCCSEKIFFCSESPRKPNIQRLFATAKGPSLQQENELGNLVGSSCCSESPLAAVKIHIYKCFLFCRTLISAASNPNPLYLSLKYPLS